MFDGQDNIRTKTRYAMEQGLKGMMSWDLATDLPLDDSKSLLKVMVEELRNDLPYRSLNFLLGGIRRDSSLSF